MGALATAALDAGGDVIGILPAGLFPDGVTASPLRDHHAGTFALEEAVDMHARKARFHALGDAFIVLPGGMGTLEEFSEVATWAQIGIHDRAIGFLDVNGYFDALLDWFDRAVADGFLARLGPRPAPRRDGPGGTRGPAPRSPPRRRTEVDRARPPPQMIPDSCPCQYSSLRSRLYSFPVGCRGSSSRKSIERGHFTSASFSRQ